MYSNKCDLCVSRPHVCIYRAVTRGLKIYFAIRTHNDVVALFDIFLYFSLDDMIIFFTFFPLSVKVVLSTPSELICELFRLTFMFANEIILNSRWFDLYTWRSIYTVYHAVCPYYDDDRVPAVVLYRACRHLHIGWEFESFAGIHSFLSRSNG